MKKIILFAAACAALAACNKEIDTTTPEIRDAVSFEKGQQVCLTANAPAATKVTGSLNATTDAVDFKWETGDKIKVTVGESSAEFTLSSGAGTASATFTGTMPAGGNSFDVQYPVTDPDLSTQTYVADGLPKDKMKMTATGCTVDTPFKLTPQYSALRLNLWGDETVNMIIVTSTSTEASYTLNITDGKKIGATSDNATPFFIVVPAGSNQFSIKVFGYSVYICKYETSSAQTFTAGQVLNMPAKEAKKSVLLPGKFTVNASGKQVQFSRANLWWGIKSPATTSDWHLEDLQTSYPTSWDANHIGLFYWTKTASASYAETYDDGTIATSDKFFADGSDASHMLTIDGQGGLYVLTGNSGEWDYLFNSRTNASSLYREDVNVIGVNRPCLVVAPDGYSGTIADSYTATEWAIAESNGLICLPRVSSRKGTTIDTNTDGYWTATSYPWYQDWSIFMYYTTAINITIASQSRDVGFAIRLVADAQ